MSNRVEKSRKHPTDVEAKEEEEEKKPDKQNEKKRNPDKKPSFKNPLEQLPGSTSIQHILDASRDSIDTTVASSATATVGVRDGTAVLVEAIG